MNIHRYQMEILRQLLFQPESRFTDLNLSGLSSDHFTYHIKKLQKKKMVTKVYGGKYSLTDKGKEFANQMDTDKIILEKQPKVAVIIFAEREIDGVVHMAFQKRKKEPYYGYEGMPTGKVRYGETILEAAVRELKEECDLESDSKDCEVKFILHEHVYSPEGELLEDKIFHVVKMIEPEGEIKSFEGGENRWLPLDSYPDVEKKFYSDTEIYNWYMKGTKKFFIEKDYNTEQF